MTTVTAFRFSVLDAIAREVDYARSLAELLRATGPEGARDIAGRIVEAMDSIDRSLSLERMTVEHEQRGNA